MLTAEEPSGSYDGLSAANCLSFSRKKNKEGNMQGSII